MTLADRAEEANVPEEAVHDEDFVVRPALAGRHLLPETAVQEPHPHPVGKVQDACPGLPTSMILVRVEATLPSNACSSRSPSSSRCAVLMAVSF